MIIKNINAVKIDEIVEVLSSGGLTILPTETVYGAMVSATKTN